MTNDLGTLVIVILKARNLPDKHSFYKQDAFAQVQLQDIIKKSSVDVKGGQHPVWDEEVRVPILAKVSDETRTLEVSCWAQEPRGAELIGKGKVDISETLRTGEFDDWIPLDTDGVYKGELYLEMTFFAVGPAPSLSRRPSKLEPKDRLARAPEAYVYPSTATKGSVSHSKSPAAKAAPLPPLPEEPELTPAAIPAILRTGRPPTAPSHQTTSGPRYVHSPSSSPQRSPPHSPPQSSFIPASLLPSAPASLRPGRPPSQGIPFAAPRYDSYNGSAHPISASPPQAYSTPPSQASPYPSPQSHSPYPPTPLPPQSHSPYPPTPLPTQSHSSYPTTSLPPQSHSPYSSYHYASIPRNESYDSGLYPQSFSPPQSYALPALPREPQPASGLAYAPPSVRSVIPQSQYEEPTNGYSVPPGPAAPYRNESFYFPQPAVPQGPPRPYPYNYAPTPRDPDLDVPPPQLGRSPGHRPSFPLTDEAATPTAEHPPGYVPQPKQANPPLPPKQSHSHGNHAHHSHTSSASSQKSQASGRDKMLALAMEREEDERKKYLAAQEEYDLELAKKLDLELNIDSDVTAG